MVILSAAVLEGHQHLYQLTHGACFILLAIESEVSEVSTSMHSCLSIFSYTAEQILWILHSHGNRRMPYGRCIQRGRGACTDISKPNGYGGGSSACKASTSLNLSSDQQAKAQEFFASGFPRSEKNLLKNRARMVPRRLLRRIFLVNL